MIWLLITIAMGAGVVIGITAYSAANPIELPRTPCEYDRLDDDYRDSQKTLPVKDEI